MSTGRMVAAYAVSPLVVDDADTTEPGHVQVNPDFSLVRRGSTWLYSTPINPVVGVNARAEFGVLFGYQWRDGSGSTPTTNDADGITDLLIQPKLWLWQGFDDKLKLTTRLDLKLPTASEHRGLGTGNTDLGLVSIATYKLEKTDIDWNLGYSSIDISHSDFGDDQWFAGCALRRELTAKWTILAETYAVLPQSSAGGNANFYFDGGPQWKISERTIFSALIGTAVGSQQSRPNRYFGAGVRVLNQLIDAFVSILAVEEHRIYFFHAAVNSVFAALLNRRTAQFDTLEWADLGMARRG